MSLSDRVLLISLAFNVNLWAATVLAIWRPEAFRAGVETAQAGLLALIFVAVGLSLIMVWAMLVVVLFAGWSLVTAGSRLAGACTKDRRA